MIPKIIHYCWFGNQPLPERYKKYIDGWMAVMPDYQIKCWTEKDIDISSIPFAKQAYEAGKLAFVADYTRIYALFHIGGIYLDTDVCLLSSLEQCTHHRVFTAYEYNTKRTEIYKLGHILTKDGERTDKEILKVPGNGWLSAVIGAEAKHPLIKDCLDFYNSHTFNYVFENDLTIPTVLALHGEKYGFLYNRQEQLLREDIMIYKTEMLADHYNATKESIAIHYCVASWKNHSLTKKIKTTLNGIKWIRSFVRTITCRIQFYIDLCKGRTSVSERKRYTQA